MIHLNASSLFAQHQPTRGANSGSERSASSHKEIDPQDEVKLGRGASSGETPMERLRKLSAQSAPQGSKYADRTEDLRRAMNALPRDARGAINPDLLVDADKSTTLTHAVERLVMEGLGTGAEIAFEHAVHALFADYADDLSLDESEFLRAKEIMIEEVRKVVADNEVRPWDPSEPAPAMMDLDAAVEMLQDKVMSRRRLMMEASGDLSRVLSELTVTAQNGDEDDVAELGAFLQRFGQAVRARSSKSLRDDARDMLLSGNPFAPTPPERKDWGQAFLSELKTKAVS